MIEGWTERRIAAYLARVTFSRKSLLLVPNCSWPGSECDLLVVTSNLRIIDVEIKISRADLRADAKKWFHRWNAQLDGAWGSYIDGNRRRREWPAKVWKHFYCVPREIWTPDLLNEIAPVSGVLLIGKNGIQCERKSKPCRDADKLNAEDAIDIARLASLRMWDAFDALETARADNKRIHAMYEQPKVAA